jgi:site-specific DNA-cytosine methylase
MRIGSLFSGVAGLDRAVEKVFDGQVVWFAENDPAASLVLAARFPGIPNHDEEEHIAHVAERVAAELQKDGYTIIETRLLLAWQLP